MERTIDENLMNLSLFVGMNTDKVSTRSFFAGNRVTLSFIIKNVDIWDEGLYTAVASVDNTSISRNFHIYVLPSK